MSETFDYVVVGAGSAGCIVANRLTTHGGSRVCILEAGPPDRNPFIHIPAGFMKTVADPSVNWLYQSEPIEGAAGRCIPQPRGKTLGGSGPINGHIYNRGQREDFTPGRSSVTAAGDTPTLMIAEKASELILARPAPPAAQL